ncbi:gamma-glutamyltransferase [Sabulicella rubraurantiaca]|uniref:gamma-glutamyltransferase n=1 Tax=Sabulicella rubraurantiaca TaxID=2811429 RepID=UPI001A966B8F|nr:gamma-glutamyltransferase [Sabulicella rubraurantiaca]
MISRFPRLAILLSSGLALAGCETARSVTAGVFGPSAQAGQPGFVRGFLGGIASEDPMAAAAGREVLAAGGSAVDAAVAASFVMAVTLPSRAGLGGGGACVVFDPRRNDAEAVMFEARGRAGGLSGADRPAAVPMMARGLFALHTRQRTGRPFEELIAPAEQLARFGAPMTRALHADLSAVQGPLFADPESRAIFSRNGVPIAVGERFQNPALGATLTALRVSGVGDLHQGTLARRLEEAMPLAGGGTYAQGELRAALPRVVPAVTLAARGGDRASFLPEAGLPAAQAFQALLAGQQPGPLPGALPASAGLIVYDRTGLAVSCAFSLNNLFGTGRMVPGMGFLAAAAPGIGRVTAAPLSAAIGWNPNLRAFRAVAAGSGQEWAPLAVAAPLAAAMGRDADAASAIAQVPQGGRAQLGHCPRYLPGWEQLCATATDPRGAGVALGATDR